MKLSVKMKDFIYDVIIEKDSLKKVDQYFDLNRKVLILTDSGVPTKYIDEVKNKAKNSFVYTIEQGETSKSYTNYGNILDYLINNTFSRNDCIIAIGGGVVGDLAGFLASTYMRGITFYNIPTTLLSQVDSSIGGKTAIDKCGIKNVVGSFYPPAKVLIDSNVLKTLDKRQLNSGLVEAIKMGITNDISLFYLIKNSTNIFSDIDEIIIKSLKIKKMIVEEDPNEKNIRKVLNFGHTIGHAIESSGKFNTLLHGECVGIGMLYMSSQIVKKELITVLNKYNLPTNCQITTEELYEYIKLDKKRTDDTISIVYVQEMGKYSLEKVKLTDVKKYLNK